MLFSRRKIEDRRLPTIWSADDLPADRVWCMKSGFPRDLILPSDHEWSFYGFSATCSNLSVELSQILTYGGVGLWATQLNPLEYSIYGLIATQCPDCVMAKWKAKCGYRKVNKSQVAGLKTIVNIRTLLGIFSCSFWLDGTHAVLFEMRKRLHHDGVSE